MPQFDVHRLARGAGLAIDCQSDLLDHLDSRFVVPLARVAEAPPPAGRLNPILIVAGERYAMLTQAAAAIRRRDLGTVVGSVAASRLEIIGALDILLSGV